MEATPNRQASRRTCRGGADSWPPRQTGRRMPPRYMAEHGETHVPMYALHYLRNGAQKGVTEVIFIPGKKRVSAEARSNHNLGALSCGGVFLQERRHIIAVSRIAPLAGLFVSALAINKSRIGT